MMAVSVREGGIWSSLRRFRTALTTAMIGAMRRLGRRVEVAAPDPREAGDHDAGRRPPALREPLPDLLGDEGHEGVEQAERRLEDLDEGRLRARPGRGVVAPVERQLDHSRYQSQNSCQRNW